MSEQLIMVYDDFPALYRAADKASLLAQKQFVQLTHINLGLMVLAAIFGAFILSDTTFRIIFAVASGVLLTIGIFITIFTRVTRLESVWYDGRAIAESIKTLTWRYMTCSEPFSKEPSIKADELLLSNLFSLLQERQTFAAKLSEQFSKEYQITSKMREIRNLNTKQRKEIYLSDRIDEQRQWYSKKAKNNLASANKFFMGTLAAQLLAIVFAFTIDIWQRQVIQLMGVFTTLAASFIAWTQMRKNEELSQSYGLATQELSLIYEQSFQVKTDKELSLYVVNSENAISREHTMWRARRS